MTNIQALCRRIWSRYFHKPAIEPPAAEAEPGIFLSTTTPTRRHIALAMLLTGVMTLIFGLSTLFVGVTVPTIVSFVPSIDGLLFAAYFFTTVILVSQFVQLPTWSILVLIAGYMVDCGLGSVHFVAFSSIMSANQLHAFSPNIGRWISVIWHLLLPLFILAYSCLQRAAPPIMQHRTAQRALWILALTLALLLAALTAYLFGGDLPLLREPDGRGTRWGEVMLPIVVLADVCALTVLWCNATSILDLWLKVALWASLLDVLTVLLVSHQIYLGFYTSPLFAVLGAVVVLGALLHEMGQLYARLFALAQRQKRDSDAQYRAIVDTASDAILVLDEQDIITAANPAVDTVFGLPRTSLIGQPVDHLLVQPWRDVARDGRSVTEVQGRHQDGSALALEVSVAPWQRNNTPMLTAMFRDIGERKRVANQLIQAQKMEAIGQLTGGMAHDFNNVLSIIIGNLDLLVDQFPPAGVPAELNDALTASVAGADLIKQLLAFARRQPLQARLMDMTTIVNEMLPLLKRTLGGRITIVLELDPVPPVLADSSQFANALLNLAVNARDAMPDGGRLTIECRFCQIDADSSVEYDIPVGDYSTLIVSDTGSGMSPEILARVIEPFFTTKAVGKGSGLGLSMVFGYAKQSGGVLRFYSEVGHGTSVRLYLPVADPQQNAADVCEAVASADIISLHGTERILVVDDNPQARTVVQRILLSLDYQVQVVTDATEAIAALTDDPSFDLVFSDIVMPGVLDGVGLATYVRQHQPHVKILLTSGFSMLSLKQTTDSKQYFLTKPYRKYDLAILLRQIFDDGG